MIIGYGGWDEHINRLVEDALTNPGFTCVFIDPSPSAWARKLAHADACGRVYCLGGPWGKFENFAQYILPDIEVLNTELKIAKTLRDLRRYQGETVQQNSQKQNKGQTENDLFSDSPEKGS